MEYENHNIWNKVKDKLATDSVFHDTEIQANKLGTLVMFLSGVLLAVIFILNKIGIFQLNSEVVSAPLIRGMIEAGAVTILCIIFRFDRWWLKYLLVVAMTLVYASMDGIFTHKAAIIMAIPVIFSSRYFSRKITIFTAILCTGTFIASAAWGAVWGLFDLNIVSLEEGTQMVSHGRYLDSAVLDTGFDRKSIIGDALLFNFLPKWMIFSVIALISINIARRGRSMVLRQHEQDMADARIESELELARKIQADMLVNEFPAFPDLQSFDIYASMTPAREVGGDFYDFFLTDKDHLCLVIADVSGKGIPAAMFMSGAMAFIKGSVLPGKSPREILADVNDRLCEHNKDGMFVTAWLGILDLRTGKLQAANAGHEYPIFRNADGKFEKIKDKHGFVLGGMSGSVYTGYELDMTPGSSLFLYTDGLLEAQNTEQKFLGLDNTLSELNTDPEAYPAEILNRMKHRVDEFTNGEVQFDDLTMLCLKYFGDEER